MLYDVAYYGMKNEDAKLEVESEYIRDKDTARKLQRRLLMWYANQHLTMKLDLPPSYMHLEAGDYLRFDELIGGKLAFGFDYTQEFVKNGQLIYPVFFVTKVAKSLSKVSLELVQVHRGDFGMSDDDLGFYNIPNPYERDIYQDEVVDEEDTYFNGVWYQSDDNLHSGLITAVTNTNYETGIEIEVRLNQSSANIEYNDFEIPESDDEGNFPDGSSFIDATNLVTATIVENESIYGDNVNISPKLTSDEIRFLDDNTEVTLVYSLIVRSNITNDVYTLLFSQVIQKNTDVLLGDISGEGIINVLDVVQLVQIIVNADEYEPLGDMNGDGFNNVQDAIILINLIVGN